MITAHSGCDNTAPNSVEFIDYALKCGVEAFEVDVRKDNKGNLILSHDKTDEECMTLVKAFEMLSKHKDKYINCDLKEKNLENLTYELATKYGVEKNLIFTGDVNPECFKTENLQFEDVKWFVNAEIFVEKLYERIMGGDESVKEELKLSLLEYKKYRVCGINWNYKLYESLKEEVLKEGLGVSIWTVDDKEELKTYLSENLSNITTRQVEMALSIREGIKNI